MSQMFLSLRSRIVRARLVTTMYGTDSAAPDATLIAAVATLIGSVGAGVARADKPPVEFAGQPFYFSLTCTGIGGVIVVNQSLARPAALLVVGSQTVVIGPFNGAPGPARVANAQCTLTGAGFTIDTIEPVEPVTAPVLIVGA